LSKQVSLTIYMWYQNYCEESRITGAVALTDCWKVTVKKNLTQFIARKNLCRSCKAVGWRGWCT